MRRAPPSTTRTRIGGAATLAGDAGEHGDVPMSLSSHLARDASEARDDSAGVVDVHGVGRSLRVVIELGLRPEHTEGDDRDVEVAVVGREPPDERIVRVGGGGVEVLDHDGEAVAGEPLGLRIVGPSARQHERAS